jgi:hypothetical protein
MSADLLDRLQALGSWLDETVEPVTAAEARGAPVVTEDVPLRLRRRRRGVQALGATATAVAVALATWSVARDDGGNADPDDVVVDEPTTTTGPAPIPHAIHENRELQALLDLEVAGSTEVVVAQVVSGPPTGVTSTLQLDAGSADGLAVDMAVVIAGGDDEPVLIGRISDVATHAATVRLLHDRDSRIDVWIPISGRAGVLEGRGSDRLVVHDVEIWPDELPRVGQVVETSARGGSDLPPGLLIGSVSAVADPPPGAGTTDVDVRPFADLEQVTRVRVITDYTPDEVDPTATTAVMATATTAAKAGR